MAFNIVIEGGYFVLTDNPLSVEHIRNLRAETTFSFDVSNDIFQFFYKAPNNYTTLNLRLLGDDVNEYYYSDLATVTEDGRPVAISSSVELATYLSGVIGIDLVQNLTPSECSESGFMDYNDTTGSIPLVANTWTDIPNDGLGAFTNKIYKPEGITEFLDVSTGYIDTSETELGETILIRNDYKVNPNTNNALLEFRYELGNGGGIYTLEKIVGRLDSGSGQDYRFSLKPDLIYMGDTNTKDNPIKLQLRLSTNGTLTNSGSVIQLIKR